MSASPSRNDPCPCGSGRKYKACCGRLVPGGGAELGRLVALMDAGRYAELEASAQAVLGKHPNAGFVWQLLGVALSKQGKDALQAVARAAQCLPEDAVAHLNLGNALGRLGRLEEAHASYAQALALRPDFAEAHNNLGDVQLELGQLEEAVDSCRRALEAKPGYAEAHQNLGKALGRLGRLDEAVASCRRALELRPDFAEAHYTLGYALARLARLDEAIMSFRRALLIRPDFVAAHTELGTALRLQRRTQESEASCRNALEFDPNSAATLAVMAELRADAGRFAEAEELFNRVISIEPESSEALVGITRVRRMTAADAAWLAAALRLAGHGLPPAKEASLRYAIGKYFDDVEDFDNAFLSYRRANELAKRSGPRYDRNLMTRTVDLMIRSHGPMRLDAAPSAANRSARPVFIVGMLRSGTSLAEQILASHPAVFGAGELTFWATESKITMSEAELAGLGNRYLELLQRLSADALRVVDKFPTNFLLLGLIHTALPHARIIHMRRNPIDTCLSIYFQRFEAANAHANDLEDLAHYYREYRRVMRHWQGVMPTDALLDVPYEALVGDVETWSRRMLNFVGLPWDERCLEFHQTERTVVTASRWQVRQKISTSSVERWRHYEKYLGPLKSLLQAEAH